MANVKISALPQLYPIDINDFVAIVENSDTTTKQITQEKLFGGTGHTFNVTTLDNSMIFGGKDNIITSNGGNQIKTSVIVGGTSNSIGGAGTSIGDCEYGGIFAGEQNSINGGGESRGQTVIGGKLNQLQADGFLSSIVAGEDNQVSMQKAVIIGGGSNRLTSGYEGVIAGGSGNQINAGEKNFIAASNGCSLNNYPIRDFILGTESASISSARFSSIIGGYAGTINSGANFQSMYNSNGSITTNNERNISINCPNGNITDSVTESALISSSNVNISSDETNVTVLNCKPTSSESVNTVSKATYIGVFDTITGNNEYSATTHTDNLHSYKLTSNKVTTVNAASGNITIDLSTGLIFFINQTGLLNITFINARDGAKYEFIINNTCAGVCGLTAPSLTGGDIYTVGGGLSGTNSLTRGYWKGTIFNNDMYLSVENNYQLL